MRYLSKEAAATQLTAEMGEDFITFLGENPLKDAFIVKISQGVIHETRKLASIKDELEQIIGVYEVFYTKELLAQINKNIEKIALGIVILMAIFFLTVVILINSSIRLALYSQRRIIRSMQLVGATSLFIKTPFLKRAIVQGVISSIIASTCLFSLFWTMNQLLEELNTIIYLSDMLLIFLLLILVGGLVTAITTLKAINKYLQMPLERLYDLA